MRFGPAVATVYFLLVIVAQLDDPDPLVWVAAYAVAAGLSAAAAFDRYYFWPTALALAGYALAALVMLPGLAHFHVGAFTSVGMASIEDERVREVIGLLICVAWTGWLLRATLRRRAA